VVSRCSIAYTLNALLKRTEWSRSQVAHWLSVRRSMHPLRRRRRYLTSSPGESIASQASSVQVPDLVLASMRAKTTQLQTTRPADSRQTPTHTKDPSCLGVASASKTAAPPSHASFTNKKTEQTWRSLLTLVPCVIRTQKTNHDSITEKSETLVMSSSNYF